MYQIEIINNPNKLLNQVVVTNKNLNFKSVIYPNLGASLQKLSFENIDLINGITNDEIGIKTYEMAYKSSFLFPYPNRVKNGSYKFNEINYQLKCNETAFNNALHGHIHNKSFSLIKTNVTDNFAQLIFGYSDDGSTKGFPFPFKIEICYTFSVNALSINFKTTNSGTEKFPFGIGWHPYFNSDNLSESIIDFKADLQFKSNNKMIPENKKTISHQLPLKIENTQLDDCYILKKNSVKLATPRYQLLIKFSESNQQNYFQIFTPDDKKSVALEPMTCAPNAFNNKAGLLVLNPEKSYNWNISIKYTNL